MEVIAYPINSCKLSYNWDWNKTYKEGRELFRLTRFSVPEALEDSPSANTVIQTKNRIRGRGTSLGVKLVSEPGTACKIQGLAIMYTG